MRGLELVISLLAEGAFPNARFQMDIVVKVEN
jgi:hypothetical protein